MPYNLQEILPPGVLDNPYTMLCFYDDDILKGSKGVVLDDWQKDLLTFFGTPHVYNEAAIRAMLLAANGSGKSKFILAPLAIWMLMAFPESLTIITTASGAQLDGQDLRYCTMLARKINQAHIEQFPEGLIDCQYRKLKSQLTGSFIDMFATDEPGKAEGKHPLHKDGKFCIIVDEGKTVTDEIYKALERCTGFTHRLDISSAGTMSGQFYKDWRFEDKTVLKKKITAYDCSHLKNNVETRKKIDKHGINDPLIRSSIFSEFNSSEEQVVIPLEHLDLCISRANKHYNFGPLRAGLDLAGGGDEDVITIWRGNKEIERHNFQFTDTNRIVDFVIGVIKAFKGELQPENIYADDGGIGRGILDNFRNRKDDMFPDGYRLRRVLNQTAPYDKTRYANRGAESWFNFKRFVENNQVLFKLEANGSLDKDAFEQLTNRHYFISDTTGKITLESKQKAKSNGRPSPDKADAMVLAWYPYLFPVKEMTELVLPTTRHIKSSQQNNEELAQKVRRQAFERYWAAKNRGSSNRGLIPKNSESATRVTNFSHGKMFKVGSNSKYRHR